MPERFTFGLPLNEDRSAVEFGPGDGVPLDVPPRRPDLQGFTCFQVPAGRPGRVLAGCESVPLVDPARSGRKTWLVITGHLLPGAAPHPRERPDHHA